MSDGIRSIGDASRLEGPVFISGLLTFKAIELGGLAIRAMSLMVLPVGFSSTEPVSGIYDVSAQEDIARPVAMLTRSDSIQVAMATNRQARSADSNRDPAVDQLAHEATQKTVSGLLVLAAASVGALLNLPTAGTGLVVIAVVAGYRVLWALLPRAMRVVEMNPALAAQREAVLDELDDRLKLRKMLESANLPEDSRRQLEKEFDQRLRS